MHRSFSNKFRPFVYAFHIHIDIFQKSSWSWHIPPMLTIFIFIMVYCLEKHIFYFWLNKSQFNVSKQFSAFFLLLLLYPNNVFALQWTRIINISLDSAVRLYKSSPFILLCACVWRSELLNQFQTVEKINWKEKWTHIRRRERLNGVEARKNIPAGHTEKYWHCEQFSQCGTISVHMRNSYKLPMTYAIKMTHCLLRYAN